MTPDLLELRRSAVEIDEQEPKEAAQASRRETERLPIEVGHALRAARGAQRAREIVAPGVIGTGDGGDTELAFALQKAMGPMLADIEKATDLAIAVAQQKHALIQNISYYIASCLRQHGDVSNILPAAVKDIAPLPLENVRAVVIEAWQGARAHRIAVETDDGAGASG